MHLPQRKNFSKDEEAALVRLIKEYGRGCWATILKEGQDAGDIEEGRNAVGDCCGWMAADVAAAAAGQAAHAAAPPGSGGWHDAGLCKCKPSTLLLLAI